MRVVINGRFLCQHVTGVQRVAIEYLIAIDEMLARGEFPGVDVEVAIPAASPVITDLSLRRVRPVTLGRAQGHRWEQTELARYAAGSTLICFGNVAPIYSLLSRRTRVVTFIHDLSFLYFPEAYSWRFRWLYRALVPAALALSDVTVTVAEVERTSIERTYRVLRRWYDLVVLQNGGLREDRPGIEVEPLPSHLRERTALYVGSLTKRKNADKLLAAAQITHREDGIPLVIIGATGPNFSTTDRSIVPADAARFLGQIDDAGLVYEHMQRAQVFVFPSLYEASPLPPVEAMANGCPVVAADIPSIRERCGDAVLYCEPSDERSIASAVIALCEDENLWNEMQRRGLKQAAKYSWQQQAMTLLSWAVPVGRGTSS